MTDLGQRTDLFYATSRQASYLIHEGNYILVRNANSHRAGLDVKGLNTASSTLGHLLTRQPGDPLQEDLGTRKDDDAIPSLHVTASVPYVSRSENSSTDFTHAQSRTPMLLPLSFYRP